MLLILKNILNHRIVKKNIYFYFLNDHILLSVFIRAKLETIILTINSCTLPNHPK